MAAILFFPVHEHKEFWFLSLIGTMFDSVSGKYCITIHTKCHGILTMFCPSVSCVVQQSKLCATVQKGQKCCTSKKSISLHEGRCRCNISLGMMYPQHFQVCANVVIQSLLHVPATGPLSVHCTSFFVAARCRWTWPCNMTPHVWPPSRTQSRSEHIGKFKSQFFRFVVCNRC